MHLKRDLMINKALNRIKFANHANLNDLIINQEQNQRCANIYFCIAEKKCKLRFCYC